MPCFGGSGALGGNFCSPLLGHDYFTHLLLLSRLVLPELGCHNFLESRKLTNLAHANPVNSVETLKDLVIDPRPILIKHSIRNSIASMCLFVAKW